MQLNIDTLNLHKALAETPECEAKCSVTSIELPPAVAALLAGELEARKGQKADA